MQHFNNSGEQIENKEQLYNYYMKNYLYCEAQCKKFDNFINNFESFKNNEEIKKYILTAEKVQVGDKLPTVVVQGKLNRDIPDDEYLQLYFDQLYNKTKNDLEQFGTLLLTFRNLLFDLNKQ